MQADPTVAIATINGSGPMDSRRSIVAATVIGVVAVLVFIIQPGYVQGLVGLGHLSGAEAGYVASAEMIGYAITMIALAFLSHRLPWRPMLLTFIALQAAGNLASLAHVDFKYLCAVRFLAGLGEGGLSSLSFTAIGMTRNPDRQFGFLIAWILTYGAVGLFGLPSLLDFAGLEGFYIAVAAVTVASVIFVRAMPSHGAGSYEIEDGASTLSLTSRSLAAGSIFIFFLGCGIFWAYAALIGEARQISGQAVANALGISQFTGVAGAIVAGAIGSRLGRSRPLIGALVLAAAACAAIDGVGAGSTLLFGAAIGVFNFAWNLAQPIYLSAATGFDREGRLVTQMVAAQSVGLAVGPLVGALIGGNSPGAALIWVVTGLFLAAAGMIVIPFLEQTRALRAEPQVTAA